MPVGRTLLKVKALANKPKLVAGIYFFAVAWINDVRQEGLPK